MEPGEGELEALDVSRAWTRGGHAGVSTGGTGIHRQPNKAGVHGVNRANVGSMLDMTKREEEDEVEQNTVQAVHSTGQILGHQGTDVSKACI